MTQELHLGNPYFQIVIVTYAISEYKIKTDPNSTLITLDVDSMYTNIDNQAGIKAIIEAFENNPDLKLLDDEILTLLEICLKNNDFIFNKE